LKNITLPMPLFAKPIAEGTGKGIDQNSKITSMGQLRRVCKQLLLEYRQPVLVERFLPGREFTVGILGTAAKAHALATMEIKLLEHADSEVYSYRNKEECEELVRYKLLPRSDLRHAVESLALNAWRALGCRDAGRIDVRLDEAGRPGFIEVNPLAGIHPEHSDLPIMATMSGVPYIKLIRSIMESAVQRYGLTGGRQTLADRRPTLAA
jgi:D-alanine-D-alanine ligase